MLYFCMVRINRNTLDQQMLKQLLTQCAFVVSPQQPSHAQTVLGELLGYEEQVTVAKRVACIVLLVEGISPYKISRHVKLSQSTVANIHNRLLNNQYRTILQLLGKNKTDYFHILKTLDSILHLGGILPHYNGLNRYKYSN